MLLPVIEVSTGDGEQVAGGHQLDVTPVDHAKGSKQPRGVVAQVVGQCRDVLDRRHSRRQEQVKRVVLDPPAPEPIEK